MKLYKVKFIHQRSGNEVVRYALAEDSKQVEDEYADIISIEPLTPLDNLMEEEDI